MSVVRERGKPKPVRNNFSAMKQTLPLFSSLVLLVCMIYDLQQYNLVPLSPTTHDPGTPL